MYGGIVQPACHCQHSGSSQPPSRALWRGKPGRGERTNHSNLLIWAAPCCSVSSSYVGAATQFCSFFNLNDSATCPPKSDRAKQLGAGEPPSQPGWRSHGRSSECKIIMRTNIGTRIPLKQCLLWMFVTKTTSAQPFGFCFPLSLGLHKMWYHSSFPLPELVNRFTLANTGLHSGAGQLTSLLQARNGFDQCRVLLSGEAHETVPLFRDPRRVMVARCSLHSMLTEHLLLSEQEPAHTGLDKIGLWHPDKSRWQFHSEQFL